MIFIGIMAFLIMILKALSPDEFEKRFQEKLNSKKTIDNKY
ncbi:MAG: hypothetical protein A4E27_00034 [Methanobacterium sp. PtaU1.Bin242]|nr:MAG: hypothetical protein A4E27_00034 [Methanobacterium sp. PtaU1.Bin242]